MQLTIKGLSWANGAQRLVIGAAALGAIAGSFAAMAIWTNDDRLSNPGSGGEEILLSSRGHGTLELASVRASAFQTTIEVTLGSSEPFATGDTVALDPGKIHSDPSIAGLRLDGVRVQNGRATLVLLGGPLPDATSNLTLTLDEYVTIPASGDGRMVHGPWTVTGDTEVSRPRPDFVGGDLPLRTPLGGGLTFSVDKAVYDGYVLRLTYHIEGDVAGVQMFAAPPANNEDVALPLLGPAPSEGRELQVRLNAGRSSVALLLPRLVRNVPGSVQATLVRSSDGSFVGFTEVEGVPVTLRTQQSGGDSTSVIATSPAGTPLGFTRSVTSAELIDDSLTTQLVFRGASGRVAGQLGAESAFQFSGQIPSGATELLFRFVGYEVSLGDSTRVVLPLE